VEKVVSGVIIMSGIKTEKGRVNALNIPLEVRIREEKVERVVSACRSDLESDRQLNLQSVVATNDEVQGMAVEVGFQSRIIPPISIRVREMTEV